MNKKNIKIISGLIIMFFALFWMQAQAQQTPGNAQNPTFITWLTPDSYSSGLWTNHITTTGTSGNFNQRMPGTKTPPPVNNNGLNFHPAVEFRRISNNNNARNRLVSENVFGIATTDAFSILLVYRHYTSSSNNCSVLNWADPKGGSNTYNYVSRGGIGNVSSGSNVVSLGWAGGNNSNGNSTLATIPFGSSRLLMADCNNTGAGGVVPYVNGTAGGTSASRVGSATVVGNGINGSQIVIGAGSGNSFNNDGSYGMNADIQEIIILKRPKAGTPLMTSVGMGSDLQKIQSYLAVKYGITLGTSVGSGNYMNSAGTVIWNRTTNTGYNSNIFGIGRDIDTRLNQVQSRSQNADFLVMFKGPLNTYNNNSSGELTDKSYVMLGANTGNISSNIAFLHPEGTVFDNLPGGTTYKLNFHSALIYRAQITTAGTAGGSQTVNLQVNHVKPKYVIVSSTAGFVPTATRIYPIVGRIASNVVINNGDYISFAGFEALPGGVAGYNLDLWIDGDNSTNTSWENLSSAAYTLQRGSPTAPVVRNSKFNFHRELYFGNTDRSKLVTTTNFVTNNPLGDYHHTFVVSENTQSGERTLVTFNPTNSDGTARRASLQWDGTGQVRGSWSTGAAWASVTSPRTHGIMSMTSRNTGGAGNNSVRMNNSAAVTSTATQFTGDNRLTIGNGSQTSATAASGNRLPFNGTIQEVIVMRGGGALMSANNITQIKSYLAIKYGMTINGDYRRSDGTIVWNSALVGGVSYNNNIFGLAFDEASGLDQKQARSASSPFVTMWINNTELKTLNADNTGQFEDKQYFIAGSNAGVAIQRLTPAIEPETVYQNGSIPAGAVPYNISSLTYRAQWTGFTDDSLRVNLQGPQDFYYVQVSTTAAFTPLNTKLYPVTQGFAEVDFVGTYRFFRFVGFAPGPGGVVDGLQMWLRADDETSVGLQYMASTAATLGNYPIDPLKEDANNLPAVISWNDIARDKSYTYGAGPLTNAHRHPVLRRYSPEMNYHPAIRFYGGGDYGAYLSAPATTTNMILPNPPAGGNHMAYFLVNNDFGSNAWIYQMSFGSASAASNTTPGPAYGVEKLTSGANSGNIVGRFRDNSNADQGNRDLFSIGSTSMLGYVTNTNNSGGNNRAYFRFNAKTDQTGSFFNWNNVRYDHASIIGTGYNYTRIVQGVMSEVVFYNRVLDTEETRLLESYFALKYGITLFPDNPPYNRFDYTLSNSTEIWKGNVATSDATHGKYAEYYNRVAAIIRDDVARLNNRHSHSTNAGSLLHLWLAGTALKDDGSTVGYWENNLEAVIFGDDGETGETKNNSDCGKFDYRFNRVWLVHKVTKDDRPIALLVGAQNNTGLSIGDDDDTQKWYYNKLVSTNDIVLIVAKSRAELESGDYAAVVPMAYVNGEYQCNYHFTEEDTYITFGYRLNASGCYSPEEAQFEGSKTFRWTQYTSRTNRLNSTGLTIPATLFPSVELGDGIEVTSTRLVYPAGVRANRGYPRASNAPGRGGLEVRRSRGSVGQEIVISVNFNEVVMPYFSISGIDDYRYASYDNVSISGICSGTTFYPMLSNANQTPSYSISGNSATANRRSRLAGGNRNGMLHVEFQGAVERMEIRYKLSNRVRGTQRIFISPIDLYASFPPPPINEDGLGFTKHISATEVTTCETVTFTFHAINTNCEDKYVHFEDVLTAGMKWEIESLALDTINNNILYNPSLKVNAYAGGTRLEIDSLLIPGTSEIKLKATAVFDENAPSGEYTNRARMTYDSYTYLLGEILSVDRVTLNKETVINVEWRQRQDELLVEVVSNPAKYTDNDVVEITYKITNPNADVTDMYLDIDFNEGFQYIGDSFRAYGEEDEPLTTPAPTFITADLEPGADYLNIGGNITGTVGFTLQSGVTYMTFKIKTPLLENIEEELDENEQPTGRKEALVVDHNFFSEMEDPCVILSMQGLDGTTIIPFNQGKTHVISNKHVTNKNKK